MNLELKYSDPNVLSTTIADEILLKYPNVADFNSINWKSFGIEEQNWSDLKDIFEKYENMKIAKYNIVSIRKDQLLSQPAIILPSIIACGMLRLPHIIDGLCWVRDVNAKQFQSINTIGDFIRSIKYNTEGIKDYFLVSVFANFNSGIKEINPEEKYDFEKLKERCTIINVDPNDIDRNSINNCHVLTFEPVKHDKFYNIVYSSINKQKEYINKMFEDIHSNYTINYIQN